MRLNRTIASLTLLVVTAYAVAQTPAGPPAITTESLPKAALRQNYFARLRASGGTPPLHWQVAGGKLPPGVSLEADSGIMAGLPGAVGEYHFTVKVEDSERPPRSSVREFVLRVAAPLTVEWKLYPRVEGNNAIRGAVVVSNGTDMDFDLTFIAVAVNGTGKAFALGYQHLALAPDQKTPDIEFSSTLPAGQYVVHVDAVAEVPEQNEIYRARLQSSPPLSLTGLP